MRYAQLVIGPAGSGKSTFCNIMAQHGQAAGRIINVVNLDPAAEHFQYEIMADIRELIHIDDAMEDQDLKYGPNGGLIFCFEYMIENSEWLKEKLGDYDDDYILFDCPGQIELYTHLALMRRLVDLLQSWEFRICSVFLLDAQFMIEPSKFFSGVMAGLSAMVNLETPHISLLTKMDLLNREGRRQIGNFLEPDAHLLLGDSQKQDPWSQKYHNLSEAIAKLIDDYSLVRFVPLNIKDEENIGDVLMTIDNAIQYGEDKDVKVKDYEDQEGMGDDCCDS